MSYQKDNTLQLYASLLKSPAKFEAALQVIIRDWQYSCEHNLTNETMNRIAYLGQASCALIYQVPHNVSMPGFNLLTPDEQLAANSMAEKYLNLWIKNHEHSKKVQ